ncbi:uncharacterized protein palb2 [Vanacampus margaritifer]
MQSGAVWDVLRCEEQLRSTLYCDDKDNLRRKLAQLRKEYVKTAQKLQRAEQLEAVRKHVKNDVAPKRDGRRRLDQADPDAAFKPTDGASPADSSCSGTVRTPLESTPEQNVNDSACASRASPTLRLRSRRSRMRWQRRSEEGGKSQGEASFADESQSWESASSSLLLSHWNVPARQAEKQDGKRDADVPDEVCRTEKGQLASGNSLKQMSSCNVESTGGVEGKGLLESCTLVEGLLFPAEYYVRTTRRMTLSQSQPDLRAVIQAQLSSGRTRRKKASPASSGEPSAPMCAGDTPTEAVPPTRVTRPGRGRRGGGRGNLRVQRPSPYPGPSLREADSPNSHPSPKQVEPPSDHPKSASPRTQPSSASQKVFPIFHKTVKSTPVVSSSESWRSLLFLSPKLSPTPPRLLHRQLVGDLSHFDLRQDFHLPDEQFASLKLSKLRQVATESGMEAFASPCLKPTAGNSSSQSEDDKPRNADTQLTATSRLGTHNTYPSPMEEEEFEGLDRQQEALPICDRPLEVGQEDNKLQDVLEHGHNMDSQLRLSPLVASAPRPPTSSALPSSPALPSLGLTPLATSPSDAAGPSPCLSPLLRRRDFSPPILATHKTAAPAGHGNCTLKAPAGSGLVDACCLLDSDGHLCVAAAGKWAVSLWSRGSSLCAWTRRHVWPFTQPLMNVFPVPDGAGLVCVTLGRLESKEVRVLSCGGGEPALLLDGAVQAAVGVAESRVVTSSRSTTGCTLQVFTLSKDGSASCCLPLASPKVCVTALAPVDVLPDALLATDERGRLFVWNLKSGHLLRKIELDDSLSHTSCLKGFSCRGALLVLLQHEFLGSLPTKQNLAKDEMFSQQKEKNEPALFSLVAVNPLSGKSVLVAHLEPPASWSGRLRAADASDVAAVGRSESGCVCVWHLRRRDGVAVTAAPNGEGWQLARWAQDGATLVTGHRNGDVTLHFDLAAQDHFM